MLLVLLLAVVVLVVFLFQIQHVIAIDERGDDQHARSRGLAAIACRALIAQLRRELQQQVQALPASPQGRPAQIRAAVTRLETVSPGLNTLGTLLLIGPLDRGGAAVEIEAVDPQTGRQLAALRLGYFAPLSELKARFSKLAPAEIAVRKAAADFAALLKPPADAAELAQR